MLQMEKKKSLPSEVFCFLKKDNISSSNGLAKVKLPLQA